MVEMFGYAVIGIIAMVVAGFVVMNFGAKNKNGEPAMGGEDGPKGCANYVFFILVLGIVISALVKCG